MKSRERRTPQWFATRHNATPRTSTGRSVLRQIQGTWTDRSSRRDRADVKGWRTGAKEASRHQRCCAAARTLRSFAPPRQPLGASHNRSLSPRRAPFASAPSTAPRRLSSTPWRLRAARARGLRRRHRPRRRRPRSARRARGSPAPRAANKFEAANRASNIQDDDDDAMTDDGPTDGDERPSTCPPTDDDRPTERRWRSGGGGGYAARQEVAARRREEREGRGAR